MEKVRYFKLKEGAMGYDYYAPGTVYNSEFTDDEVWTVLELVEECPEDWEEVFFSNTNSIESLRGAIQPLFVVVELLNLIKDAPDAKKALVDKAISNANEIDLDKIKELLWTV